MKLDDDGASGFETPGLRAAFPEPEDRLRQIGVALSVIKLLNEEQASKMFTFHSRNVRARGFAELLRIFSGARLSVYVLSGQDSAQARAAVLDRRHGTFLTDENAVLCSVQILTEGVRPQTPSKPSETIRGSFASRTWYYGRRRRRRRPLERCPAGLPRR